MASLSRLLKHTCTISGCCPDRILAILARTKQVPPSGFLWQPSHKLRVWSK